MSEGVSKPHKSALWAGLARQQGGMEPECESLARLVRGLNEANVPFAVWKGIGHLPSSLLFLEGDIDLVFPEGSSPAVELIFLEAGFIIDFDSPEAVDGTRQVFRTFDSESSKFIEIEATYGFVLCVRGKAGLVIEEFESILSRAVIRHGFPVIAETDYLETKRLRQLCGRPSGFAMKSFQLPSSSFRLDWVSVGAPKKLNNPSEWYAHLFKPRNKLGFPDFTLVGHDGAGKSTAVAALAGRLSEYARVHSVYLGRAKWGAVLQSLRRLREKHERSHLLKVAWITGSVVSLWWRVLVASLLSRLGWVIVYDRSLLEDVLKFEALRGLYASHLARITRHIARLQGSSLQIQLYCDPNLASERKPGMPAAEIADRHSRLSSFLKTEKIDAWPIDTGGLAPDLVVGKILRLGIDLQCSFQRDTLTRKT